MSMSRLRMRALSALVGACLVAMQTAQGQGPPAIADFAAGIDFSSPALSPDGSKIAFVTRAQDMRVLDLVDLASRERVGLMPATVDSFEVDWCNFKSDDRLICGLTGTAFEDGRPYPLSRLVSIDVTRKQKPTVLVQGGPRGASQFQDRILDWQINDPRRVLIELTDERGPFSAVNWLDVYNGKLGLVQRSRTNILGWRTDRQGVVRFGWGYNEEKFSYITRDSAEAEWRTLASWELGETGFDVLGFGPVPGTLLVSANHNGRRAIFEMDLSEKSDRQLLFANAEVDVASPLYWPSDRRLIGFTYETDRQQRFLFDSEAKALYQSIDVALPNAVNMVVDASRDGNKLLIGSYADVRPAEFFILDIGARKLQRVGSANPRLATTTMAPMKPVKIKAPDGAVLPGYLTVPVGSSGKKLPTVVYPHGGPYARDTWGFEPMVQFMASRGYAVLQVNFRGSTGYGYEWYEAGLRNWGTVMVDDITAATKWAIAEGISDPARTCIVGWSYGGYAALMSAVREPDLYRCVASIAGVSDLRALAQQERRFYGGRFRANHSIGSDVDELKAGSPLRAPERIKAPVLLVHGDADIQVVVDHSKRMARALDGAKKKHELVVIKDGNHALSRFEWREMLLTRLESFLAANSQ
jgi:dipeptidyl aminopeptidase/acylaminoacyl peptidase